YNQIQIIEEDQHKTTFIAPWETFCYKSMTFGLKNAEATYQRAMTVIFHDMMNEIIKDYVHDILAKSKSREEHPEVLRCIFQRLGDYK
ncbi:hypothetical protein KI387_037339, partial [Taxus chinensis]